MVGEEAEPLKLSSDLRARCVTWVRAHANREKETVKQGRGQQGACDVKAEMKLWRKGARMMWERRIQN